MPVSVIQAAKRFLVNLLLTFARHYQVTLTISRDSDDKDVVKAFKKLIYMCARTKKHSHVVSTSRTQGEHKERTRSAAQRSTAQHSAAQQYYKLDVLVSKVGT